MKKALYALTALAALAGCAGSGTTPTNPPEAFVRVQGHDLISPDGSKLFIRGTNLGNWLNPEGYMFGFGKTNSARMINGMFCQMVGRHRRFLGRFQG